MNWEQIEKYFLSFKFFSSVFTIIIAIAVLLFMRKYVRKYLKDKKIVGRKAITIQLVNTIVKYIVIVLSIVFVLQINGVNVNSLVAGLGIVGIVVGFALQNMLQDFIMGGTIIADEFYSVGDVVKYKDIVGKVVFFNIRVTKIKDANTGNIFSVSNRKIDEIEKVSDRLALLMPIGYNANKEAVEKSCEEIAKRIAKLEFVKRCDKFEIDEFCDSFIQYRLLICCNPYKKNQVRRSANRIISDVFSENKLEIPYPQLDVHMDK